MKLPIIIVVILAVLSLSGGLLLFFAKNPIEKVQEPGSASQVTGGFESLLVPGVTYDQVLSTLPSIQGKGGEKVEESLPSVPVAFNGAFVVELMTVSAKRLAQGEMQVTSLHLEIKRLDDGSWSMMWLGGNLGQPDDQVLIYESEPLALSLQSQEPLPQWVAQGLRAFKPFENIPTENSTQTEFNDRTWTASSSSDSSYLISKDNAETFHYRIRHNGNRLTYSEQAVGQNSETIIITTISIL